MPSMEEILITFLGRDEVTPVADSIARTTQSSFDAIASNATNGAEAIASSYNSTFDQIGRGLSTLNMGMMKLSSMSGIVMSELGSTKSAMDWVYGTTSKEDTNKVLVSGLGDATESAEDLYNTIDKVTDGSLTSMQDLIPAVNAFHSATQASAIELDQSVVKNMADFGAFVLAQTGSTQLALTAMMDLSKGIKGQFSALDQYGISLASMENTGLWKQDTSGHGKKWKGDEHDIKGYMEAVKSLLGDTDALMDTNEGLNAQMGKMWSRAGKRIGHEMMPGLKSLKTMFIELDEEMNGDLSTGILRVALAIEETSQKAYTFNTLYDSMRNLSGIAKTVLQHYGFLTAETDANTIANLNNNDALMANTDLLYDNTNAKLNNADATMMMNDALLNSDMSGIPVDMSDALSSGGGVQPQFADDVASTSTEQSLKETGLYAGADIGTDVMLSKIQNRSNSFDDLLEARLKYDANRRQFLETLRDEDKVITSLMMETGLDEENTSKIMNKVLDDMGTNVEESYDKVNNLQKINDEINISDALLNRKNLFPDVPETNTGQVLLGEIEDTKELNNQWGILKNEQEELVNTINLPLSKIPTPDVTPNEILKETEELLRTDTSIDNIANLAPVSDIGGVTNAIAQSKLNTNKLITETTDLIKKTDGLDDITKSSALDNMDNIVDVVDGPFQKLENFFTKKEKRDVPDLGITKRFEELEKSILSPFKKGSSRFGNAKKEMDLAFEKMGGLSKSQKADTFLDGLKKSFQGLTGKGKYAEVEKMVKLSQEEMDTLAQVMGGDAVKNTTNIMKGGEQLAQGAGQAGVIGAQMGEAEAGLSFMALSEMGLASAFTTLIVPTLAIAGVIAVLIPIIAGLAIEALFFINLVGQVMASMNWDSIDVTGATESLQELATALAWLGVAMASLSFASLFTGVATLLTVGGNIELVIGQAVTMLTKTAEKINELGAIPPVNPLIAENVQRLGGILNDISSAMLSLSGVQLSSWIGGILTGFGLFGTLADSIDRAKSDIQHAIDSINSMNFTGIDESKVNQIKTTCDAIASFADAFSGLTKIRGDDAWSDFTSWLLDGGFFGGGGKSIEQAFNEAHDDIVNASKALQQFTDISDIDQTTVDKLTKVGDSIGAMGTAFEGLRKMRDDGNWDSFVGDFAGGIFKGKDDIMTAFRNAKEDIATIAQELKGFGSQLPKIPESLPTKLQAIGDTLTGITNALNSLQTIQGLGGKKGINFTNFVTAIQQARKSLKKVGDELKKLGSGDKNGKGALVEIPEGLPGKLKSLSKSLTSISDAITALSTIQQASAGGANFTNFVTTIEQAKDGLVKVSAKLKELDGDKNLQGVSTELVTKLKNLSKSLTSISDAITALSTLQTQTGGTIDVESIGQLIDDAKKALVKVSGKLKSLQNNKNFQAVGTELPAKIKNITSSLNKIIGALKSLRKLEALAGEGGLNVEGINTLIKDAKDAIVKVSSQLKSLQDNSDFQAVDATLGEKIKSVTKNVNKLSGFVNAMSTFPATVDGEAIGTKVGNAVKGVKKASSQLKKITQGDNIEGVGTILSNIKKAVSGLKNTIKAMSFGSSGQHIGLSLSKGVTSGLTGLTPRVTGAIGHTASAGGTRAYGVGSRIGKRLTAGFKAGLNLVDAINGEIDNLIQTMDSRAGEVESASNAMSGGGAGLTDLFTTTDFSNGNQTGSGPGGSLDTLVSATNTMVRSMGNSNVANQPLSSNTMNGLRNMNGQSQLNANNQPVNIIVSEGAVQLDARDLTVKESRQVMINALESLDMIKNIDLQY